MALFVFAPWKRTPLFRLGPIGPIPFKPISFKGFKPDAVKCRVKASAHDGHCHPLNVELKVGHRKLRVGLP